MATTKAAPGKKGLINFDFLQKLVKAQWQQGEIGEYVEVTAEDIANVITRKSCGSESVNRHS